MARYRDRLPQTGGKLFLTDGGLETTLIFHEGLELPEFASFTLLDSQAGMAALRKYFRTYLDLARERGAGFVLESPTWRANPDWGKKLGYSEAQLDELNRRAIELMAELQGDAEDVVISANVGPRGDGYQPGERMSADEAERYHDRQIGVFARTEADLVSAFTLNYLEEALGIARAARKHQMPVVLSFTVETDGKLPTGQALHEAIEAVERDSPVAYYMVNCAHPEHFRDVLHDGPWLDRIGGLRVNSSRRSHQELNDSPDLDIGDIEELGALHRELLQRLKNVRVLGGCCGTDHRHVEAIHRHCC